MSVNFDNRKRAFADVVSIDAWHHSFNGKARVDLHVDVVFGTARVGGEVDSPVRFRLSVKQAEIVVVIPPTEPLAVDRSSVSRDSADLPARLTEVVERSAQGRANGRATGSISTTGISGAISAEAAAHMSLSSTQTLKMSALVESIIVTQSKTADGHYHTAAEHWKGGHGMPQKNPV